MSYCCPEGQFEAMVRGCVSCYISNILSFISVTVLKFHDGSGGGEGGLSDNRVPDSAAAAGEGSSGYAYTTSCLVKGKSENSVARLGYTKWEILSESPLHGHTMIKYLTNIPNNVPALMAPTPSLHFGGHKSQCPIKVSKISSPLNRHQWREREKKEKSCRPKHRN